MSNPKSSAKGGNFRVKGGTKGTTTHRFAISPTKPGVDRLVHESCGWRLEAVSRTANRVEDVTADTNEFDTCIAPVLEEGTYFEIHPDPNLHRSGYMFVGPVIIGHDHIGSITIPLYKFREGDDLELPATIGRLFLKVEREEQVFCDARQMQSYSNDMGGNISYPTGGAVPQTTRVPPRQTGGNSMW